MHKNTLQIILLAFICLSFQQALSQSTRPNRKTTMPMVKSDSTIGKSDTAIRKKNTPQITILNEVSIKGEQPLVKRKADRIIYNLKADPESQGNNVLTMMRKVPYLSLDGDDNLLLKGNSSFKVLINGKPSASLENNLKSVLKSIPASTIERIEVITIPPSKYDAEGLAGIINIVTSKRTSDGYNGSVNLNENFPAGGPGAGASFTAKLGKIGISANGGASRYENPGTKNTSSRESTAGQESNTERTALAQQGNQYSNQKTAYLSTEVSYSIDTLHLLTAQFNYNGQLTKEREIQESTLNDPNSLLQGYRVQNENKGTGHVVDAGLNYEIGFKDKRDQFLTFSYQFGTNLNDRNENVNFENQYNFSTPNFVQQNHQKFTEHTLQGNFAFVVKKVMIEAGVKGILRANTSNFSYLSFNNVNGAFELDPLLSNHFTNSQDIFSAYNSYQLKLGSWNINAGLRLEQTSIRANFWNTGSITNQDYLNLVPSVAVNTQFKDQSSLNFGFTQRIRRPGINRLNPYVDRSNPNYEITGNPNLRPVVLNNIQFGYGINKKLSVNMGLDYSFMNNLDLQVINFNPETGITQITYANAGKSSSIGLNLNLGYSAGIYKVSLNGNSSYLWLKGAVDGQEVQNNILMTNAILSQVVRLEHGWALNADIGFNSGSPTGLQGRTNGFLFTAFNFNKEVIKDRFGISGGIKNPFTKYRKVRNTSFGFDFIQAYESSNYFRSFSVSLNYNFGRLKEGIQKNRAGIQNRDMSN